MAYDFSQITEVSLSEGRHEAPEQGMCMMEMVAWFAGEEHSDRPECVCPVLGAYGREANDQMPYYLRDTLLKPLVPLVVGTFDPDAEKARAEFLVIWAVNKVLPVVLRKEGREKEARACESVGSLPDAARAARAVNAAYAALAANTAANTAAYTASAAAYTAGHAAYAADAVGVAVIWPIAIEGYRRAILIGKNEGTIAFEPRMEALRKLVAA